MPKKDQADAEVIVERVFDVFEMAGGEAKRGAKGRAKRMREQVSFRVYRPTYGDAKFGEDVWVCRYRIDGPEIAITRRLPGVDSLQALMNAVGVAEKDLYDLGERIGHLGQAGFTSVPLVADYCDRAHRDILWHLQNVEQIRFNRLYELGRKVRDARAAKR